MRPTILLILALTLVTSCGADTPHPTPPPLPEVGDVFVKVTFEWGIEHSSPAGWRVRAVEGTMVDLRSVDSGLEFGRINWEEVTVAIKR